VGYQKNDSPLITKFYQTWLLMNNGFISDKAIIFPYYLAIIDVVEVGYHCIPFGIEI
jgi:hypothetical protein